MNFALLKSRGPIGAAAICSVLAGTSCLAAEPDIDAPKAKPSVQDRFTGFRVLVWIFDKNKHALKGFDQGVAHAGKTLRLKPTGSYEISYAVGEVKPVTLLNIEAPDKEWQEWMADFKITHGRSSSEGVRNLTEPGVETEWGGDGVYAVSFIAPRGTLESPRVKTLLDATGDTQKLVTALLEDLLLASVQDGLVQNSTSALSIASVASILGKSQRGDRWRSLLEEKDFWTRSIAGGVLMSVRDPAGETPFCDACLAARGNRQIALIELLVTMPQSNKALATMVELIIRPEKYLLHTGDGVATLDEDRRFQLFGALFDYPAGKLRPYAPQLIAWAKVHKEAAIEKRLEKALAPDSQQKRGE